MKWKVFLGSEAIKAVSFRVKYSLEHGIPEARVKAPFVSNPIGKRLTIWLMVNNSGTITWKPIFAGRVERAESFMGKNTELVAYSALYRLRRAPYTLVMDDYESDITIASNLITALANKTNELDYGSFIGDSSVVYNLRFNHRGTAGELMDSIRARTGRYFVITYSPSSASSPSSNVTEVLHYKQPNYVTGGLYNWSNSILQKEYMNAEKIVNKVTVRVVNRSLVSYVVSVNPAEDNVIDLSSSGVPIEGTLHLFWAPNDGSDWIPLIPNKDYYWKPGFLSIVLDSSLEPGKIFIKYYKKSISQSTAEDSTSQSNYGLRETLVEVEDADFNTSEVATSIISYHATPKRGFEFKFLNKAGAVNTWDDWLGDKIKVNYSGTTYEVMLKELEIENGIVTFKAGEYVPSIEQIVSQAIYGAIVPFTGAKSTFPGSGTPIIAT